MAITWQNISTPSFTGSNALLNAGADRIGQGLSSLSSSVAKFGELETKGNTDPLLEQVLAASSKEEIDKLAGSDQFSLGNLQKQNVNTKEILKALNSRKKQIDKDELEAIANQNAKDDDAVNDIKRENTLEDVLYAQANKGEQQSLLDQRRKNEQYEADNFVAQKRNEELTRSLALSNAQKQAEVTAKELLRQEQTQDLGNQLSLTEDAGEQARIIGQAKEDNTVTPETVKQFEDVLKSRVGSTYDNSPYPGDENFTRKSFLEAQMTGQDNIIASIGEPQVVNTLEGGTVADVTDNYLKENVDNLGSVWGGLTAEEVKILVNKEVNLSKGELTAAEVSYALKSVPDYQSYSAEEALKAALLDAKALYQVEQKKQVAKTTAEATKAKLQQSYNSRKNAYFKEQTGNALFPGSSK